MLVKRVDQDDETFGLIALVLRHRRDLIQHQRVEALCQRDVVGRAKGMGAEIGKRRARHAAGSLRQAQLMPLHRQHHGLPMRHPAQPRESPLQSRPRAAASAGT